MKPTPADIARARRDAERIIEDGSSLGWQQATELARILLAVTSDPTPLPAPALGMRVWVRWQEGSFVRTEPRDIKTLLPGATWVNLGFAWDNMDLITDYRKGDVVLWERS